MKTRQEPFRRLPFESIAEKHPHRYFESRGTNVDLESAHFGIHRAHVREMGTGTPLLLIHGLMTTSYSWRFVPEAGATFSDAGSSACHR